MTFAGRLGLVNFREALCRKQTSPWQKYSRSIATHTFSHHASLLSIIPTKIDTASAEFRGNAARYEELMANMQELHQKIERGGPEKAREKHIARGKMLPREYVLVF